jgi:GT2 family glycosyltransferase
MAIDLSIIIVNWNTKQLLLDCLASLRKHLRTGTAEIIVVDNGSTDASVEAVQTAFPEVTVIANKKNRGFAAANNQGIRIMQGRYAVLLNSDTIVTDDSLGIMFDHLE